MDKTPRVVASMARRVRNAITRVRMIIRMVTICRMITIYSLDWDIVNELEHLKDVKACLCDATLGVFSFAEECHAQILFVKQFYEPLMSDCINL